MCGLGIFSPRLYYYYYYSLICFAHCVPMVTTIYLIAAKMMVQFVSSRLHPQISNGQVRQHTFRNFAQTQNGIFTNNTNQVHSLFRLEGN